MPSETLDQTRKLLVAMDRVVKRGHALAWLAAAEAKSVCADLADVVLEYAGAGAFSPRTGGDGTFTIETRVNNVAFIAQDNKLSCCVPSLGVILIDYQDGHPVVFLRFNWNTPICFSPMQVEQIPTDRVTLVDLKVRHHTGNALPRLLLSANGVESRAGGTGTIRAHLGQARFDCEGASPFETQGDKERLRWPARILGDVTIRFQAGWRYLSSVPLHKLDPAVCVRALPPFRVGVDDPCSTSIWYPVLRADTHATRIDPLWHRYWSRFPVKRTRTAFDVGCDADDLPEKRARHVVV